MQRLACFVSSGVVLCELSQLGEQAPEQRAHLVDRDGAGLIVLAPLRLQLFKLLQHAGALMLQIFHPSQHGGRVAHLARQADSATDLGGEGRCPPLKPGDAAAVHLFAAGDSPQVGVNPLSVLVGLQIFGESVEHRLLDITGQQLPAAVTGGRGGAIEAATVAMPGRPGRRDGYASLDRSLAEVRRRAAVSAVARGGAGFATEQTTAARSL